MDMNGPVKAAENELVLYFGIGSFFSDRARLALLEKGLQFKNVVLDLTKKDHLAPWYIRICPQGTVPTLQHGNKFIPDSVAILNYLDDTFGEPLLQPDPKTETGQQVKSLSDSMINLNVPLLTYGSLYHQDLTVDCQLSRENVNMRKAKMTETVEEVRKRSEEDSDLKETYGKKLEGMEKMKSTILDRSLLEAEISRVRELMIQLEDHLAIASKNNVEFLFSGNFTTADILLAVLLRRLRLVGLSKGLFEDALPNVTAYFQRVLERPSVKELLLPLQ